MDEYANDYVNKNNYQIATFEQWEISLNNIYSVRNEKRTPSEMWLRVVSDASKVGEAARKGEPYEALDALVHTFGWIITTCHNFWDFQYVEGVASLQTLDGKPHHTLSDIVLSKYPMLCPYCGKNLCHCGILRKFNEGEKKEDRKRKQRDLSFNTFNSMKQNMQKQFTIADFAKMFEDIYGQSHYEIPIEKITFHFIEEVGEVAQCITSLHDNAKSKDAVIYNVQLSEELADVVAWGFAVTGKLSTLVRDSRKLAQVFFKKRDLNVFDKYLSSDHQLLSQWMWQIFTKGRKYPVCHTCGKRSCRC